MGRSQNDASKRSVRRQWGSDRRSMPIPMVPPPVSDRRIMLGRLAIVLSVAAWVVYVFITIVQQFVEGQAHSARLVIEAIAYLLVVTALTASALAYLLTRIGFFYRSRAHRRVPRAVLDAFFARDVPSVTVLIPSYQEDERVVRTTLLSAALQEHPSLRVVLLVDDPPHPTTAAARALLEAARALPGRVQAELAVPLERARAAADRFESLLSDGRAPTTDDMRALAQMYTEAADWLRELGGRHEMVDHADDFFVDHVIGALARDLDTIAAALRAGADEGATLPPERLVGMARRVVATFHAELSSFERKQYESSSHLPNKAMNLNSYISLMGGSFHEVSTPTGRALVRCPPAMADLVVPDPDYVLTLDADSVLLPEYCARLLYLMEQNGFADVAVAQTPYSSYPGAATRVERIAGATTDVQHIVHQGMTHYDATFWVGANALLRKRALDDIVTIDHEGNWEVRRYIQDRTVIEDTESTIDLGINGWSLYNYPERLSYSSTPPDFGSLCIQRQRWANGGLLILSRLREKARARRSQGERNRFGELFLRANYMASIFWASICLLILLIYPFNAGLLKPILPLIALPYFAMMASDLKYCGYKRLDVLRIYGFNLILLPVNLSGTFASLLQLITGEKSAFKRTPKVQNRTTARPLFILAPIALIVYSVIVAVLDVQREQWSHLFFAALNAALALYALVAFVGIRNGMVDLWMHLRSWLYRPVPAARQAAPTLATSAASAASATSPALGVAHADWVSVLHHGGTVVPSAPRSMPGPDERVPSLPPTARQRRGGHTVHSEPVHDYAFFTAFQPVVALESGEVVGYEALSRFADGQSPLAGLAEAMAAGLGVELDSELARTAVAGARKLPEAHWLAVNLSVELAGRPDIVGELARNANRPLVVELDGDDAALEALVDALGALPNVQVAIDDDGVGYETMSRIERLRPAFVKLHRETVADLESDVARQAAVRSLVEFAEQHGCTVVAEGVETAGERDALLATGVLFGQGYFIGRPLPVDRLATPIAAAAH